MNMNRSKGLKYTRAPILMLLRKFKPLCEQEISGRKEPRKAKIPMPGRNIRPVAEGKVRNSAGEREHVKQQIQNNKNNTNCIWKSIHAYLRSQLPRETTAKIMKAWLMT